jgi:hypothetical protein
MRRIPEEHGASAVPAGCRLPIEDVVLQDQRVRRAGDDLRDAERPARKCLPQIRAPLRLRDVRPLRERRRGPPVDLPGPQLVVGRAAAGAEDLSTRLRPVEREVADAAEDGLAGVARRTVVEHVSSHDRVEAVGADQQVAGECRAVAQRDPHLPVGLLERDDL